MKAFTHPLLWTWNKVPYSLLHLSSPFPLFQIFAWYYLREEFSQYKKININIPFIYLHNTPNFFCLTIATVIIICLSTLSDYKLVTGRCYACSTHCQPLTHYFLVCTRLSLPVFDTLSHIKSLHACISLPTEIILKLSKDDKISFTFLFLSELCQF